MEKSYDFIYPKKYNGIKDIKWDNFEGIIFDFDQTVSSIHVWHYLARKLEEISIDNNTPENQLKMAKTWDKEYIQNTVFGGENRCNTLRNLMGILKKRGYQLFICSRGYYFVIKFLLDWLLEDSSSFFTKIFANGSPTPSFNGLYHTTWNTSGEGKYGVLNRIMEENLILPSKSFIFIDDDLVREINKITKIFATKIIDGTALIIHIHTPTIKQPIRGMSIDLMELLETKLIGNLIKTNKYRLLPKYITLGFILIGLIKYLDKKDLKFNNY